VLLPVLTRTSTQRETTMGRFRRPTTRTTPSRAAAGRSQRAGPPLGTYPEAATDEAALRFHVQLVRQHTRSLSSALNVARLARVVARSRR
jgi:hypothetical protein